MPHNVRLFLVRHATSAANLDKKVNAALPDSKVPLAPHGFDQAVAAGKFIREYLGDSANNPLNANLSSFGERLTRIRMLVSPYLRTRQTADGVVQGMQIPEGYPFDRREELALREISFGLFDGIPDDELPTHFPLEYAHYKKHVDFDGEFYAPMPLGESRIQVADRVKSVFGTILRDADPARTNPIRNFIIVSHGMTLRAFVMQWLHLPAEWYEQEPNPKNASVMIIESDGVNPYELKYAFPGFERTATAQDEREDHGV